MRIKISKLLYETVQEDYCIIFCSVIQNEVKNSIICDAVQINSVVNYLRDIDGIVFPENDYVKKYKCDNINMADGRINISVYIHSSYYYQMLSDMMGAEINNEYDFITELKTMSDNKRYCGNVMDALEQVNSNHQYQKKEAEYHSQPKLIE